MIEPARLVIPVEVGEATEINYGGPAAADFPAWASTSFETTNAPTIKTATRNPSFIMIVISPVKPAR